MTYDYRYENNSMLKKGFTLIELMFGLLIIGLLTAAAFYTITTVMSQAKRSTTNTHLQTLKTQIMLYKTEKGDYPKTLPDLVKAGMVKTLPKDGWDRPYVYRLTPEGKNPFELYSYGPSGKAGTKESRLSAWSN